MWKACCVYTSHAGSIIPRLADVCNQRVYIPSSTKFCVRLSKEKKGDHSLMFSFQISTVYTSALLSAFNHRTARGMLLAERKQKRDTHRALCYFHLSVYWSLTTNSD